METLEAQDTHKETVNISVSHIGLAKNVKGEGDAKMCFSSQAQNKERGPRMFGVKTLNGATNKIHTRPIITKPTKPTVGPTQQVKEIKILKRRGEVWRKENSQEASGVSPVGFKDRTRTSSMDSSFGGAHPTQTRESH